MNKRNLTVSYALMLAGLLAAVPATSVTAASTANVNAVSAPDSKVVSGKVVDDKGDPIIGATVRVVGAKEATVTDVNGNFRIAAEPNAKLQISYVGYVSQTVSAARAKNVSLAADSQMLDETVVVGYGVQKKSSVTGAISQVKAADIMNRTFTDAQQALQGKTAGVQLLSSSGAPGQSGSIRIRGYSSNAGSDPLYVVDGLRTNDISNLDPNDIASMEVLKDAASAAIYGAEAGNGVILITTKKASGGVTHITYDAQFTIQKMDHIPDAMNAQEYVQWMNKESGLISDQLLAARWDGTTDTKWKDIAFENGFMQKHNIALSGSNDRGSLYTSLTYTNNNGPVAGDKDTFKRVNFTLNADYKIKPWLKITTNNVFSKYTTKSTYDGQSGNANINGSLFLSTLQMDPLTPEIFTEEYLSSMPSVASYVSGIVNAGHTLGQNGNGDYYGLSLFTQTNNVNPHIMLNRRNSDVNGWSINGATSLELSPIKHFVLTSRLAYRYNTKAAYTYTAPNYVNDDTYTDYMSVSTTDTNIGYWQWENFLNYTQSFGKHNINAMVGISYSDQSTHYVTSTVSGQGTYGSSTYDLGFKKQDSNYAYFDFQTGSAVKSVAGGETLHVLKYSAYGRASYDYDNKYFAQFSLRADAADTSILPTKKRWGYFPSASIGWQVTNEKWLKDVEWLSHLKLRASWGQNGSTANLSNYMYASVISSAANRSYTFDNSGAYSIGSQPSSTGNPELKWETSEQFDFGIDTRFFNSRLGFTMDYFIKKTKDLIISGTKPSLAIGNTVSPVNAGDVENKGWEFELSWRDKIGDFSYGISANLATLKNEVTYVDPSLARVEGGGFNSMTLNMEKGYPIWYMRGYDFAYIDAQTGNPMFYKYSDGKRTGEVTETPGGNDLTMIGSAIPDFTYGITLNAAYKGFDLTVFGTGSKGNQAFLALQRAVRLTNNTLEYWYEKRWTGTGCEGALYPRLGTDVNNTAYFSSSAMVEDASYFKIKQIQLGYTLPKALIKKIHLDNVRIYCSLDDFITFTSYPGFDPEIQQGGSSLGLDMGSYPTTKKVVFGLNLQF